ncbi:MAG TPA: Crp/Fnr family transcriptional regulator [Prolixibacteraceae bacterium]|nr:Crp/Fnr family transcriptional regulator [Prolixibacteraceae bacterium]HPS13441.1 Crp/Fnr family transcriptional regulator [Prolixibacteraceae bacterium]
MKTILDTDSDFICDIQAPCFQTLSPEEVQLVRNSKTQILFRKGDNLTKQGAFTSYTLFLIKGMAIQYIEGEGNKTFNLRIIKPGEFIGLSAVFQRNVFNYSSVALTECQVFLIEKEAINQVCHQNGTFATHIVRRYFEQNSNLYEKMATILYKQMNGRLADALLYLDGLKSENHELFQLLSRKDIADFAGISTESTVKLLKSFEKDGLIRLKEKDIEIVNRDSLIEISKHG